MIGPFVDLAVGNNWILAYELTGPALICLLLSCGIAVAVNISQFMCLGRFSAVTFQVRPHPPSCIRPPLPHARIPAVVLHL